MESALAWIGQIASWIGQWIPRWFLLPVTEGGYKQVRKQVIQLKPGINFYWPVTSRIDTYPVVRQTDNLPSQTLMTKDGKVITVSGMVVYRINDIVKLLTQTHSPERMITDISLAVVHSECCYYDLAVLHEKQQKGTLDTILKNAAQKQLAEYGVEVIKLQLTDFAPSKVFRLVQTTSSDAL